MKKNKLKFLVIPSILVFSMLTGCSKDFSNLSDTNKITANSKIKLDDKLIVKFKPNVTQTQIKDLHKQIGINSFNTISKELNMTEVKIKNSHDINSLKDKYQKSNLVEYAEKDGKLALFSYTASNVDSSNKMSTKAVTGATPNDSFYSLQWNAKNMEADKAWTITTGSKNVTVAVIDSGVDPDHPDLQDNLLPLIDIVNEVGEADTYRVGSTTIDYAGKDGNGHGTHVTGILAAKINNNQGVAGMAGNVQILPIKAANHEGNTSASIITKSILRAIDKGVKVINLSIGGPKSEGTQALRDSVDLAIAKGIVFISATGNESNRLTNFVEAVTVPAAYPGVLAVSAVTRFDKVPNYSNGGPETEIAAPGGGSGKPGEGEKIYSTWPTYKTFEGYRAGIVGPYTYLSGTSMSCPHVSATAALLLTKYPNLTAQQVRVRILATTTDVDATGFDNATGFGKLNAYKALTENSHDKKQKDLP